MPRAIFLRTELDTFSSGTVELVTLTLHDKLEPGCTAIGFGVFNGRGIHARNNRFPRQCEEDCVDKRAFPTKIGTKNEINAVMKFKITLLETAKSLKPDPF